MIAGVVKDLVQVVLVKLTGAAKVTGTVYVVARLELDGDADDGKYWCSTHSAWETSPHAFPTATYELGGAWAYQRPAGMTTSKVSATKPARVWSRMTDNAAAPESETACSSELEEMIYSTGAAEAATGAAASVTGAVGSVTGAVASVTGAVGSIAAGGITAASFASGAIAAAALAADALTGIADAVLKRDFSSVTGEAARSLLNAARFLRNKWSVAAGTLTVMKEDDTAPAWTATVVGTTGADPITSSDPA